MAVGKGRAATAGGGGSGPPKSAAANSQSGASTVDGWYQRHCKKNVTSDGRVEDEGAGAGGQAALQK